MLVITFSCFQFVFRSYHYNGDQSNSTCKINKSTEKVTKGRCVKRTLKKIKFAGTKTLNSRLN